MIDGAIVGKGAIEALSLFHTLVKMIETAKAEGNTPSFEQLIAELPPQALKLATQFVDELKELRQGFAEAFKKSPGDLDKTLAELQAQTWWWRQKRYKLLRDFAPTVHGITVSIDTMLRDFVALANCKEKDALVAESYAKVEDIKRTLAARGDLTKQSLRTILDNLIADAEEVRSSLAKMVLSRS